MLPEPLPHPASRPLQGLLRVVTAILFAFGTWRFVDRFHLLDFRFAAELCAVIVFTAFLLFSQKYEAALTALSLAAALFLSFKAARLPDALPPRPEREAVLNRLSVAAARVRLEGLKDGTYPATLHGAIRARITSGDRLEYCVPPCPWPTPDSPAAFWLRSGTENSRDKEKTLWYISDLFQFFSLNQADGSLIKISADQP